MKDQNLFNEEWDICIILDACRYDTFEQVNTLKGSLEPRKSPNSCTKHWVRDAFPSEPQQDIVYLSGNPYISNTALKELGKPLPYFHIIYSIWKYGWDTQLLTVHPEEVNTEAYKHVGRYPNKRYIIHYMQPHYPYIGSKYNDGIGCGAPMLYGRMDPTENIKLITIPDHDFSKSEVETIWSKLQDGKLSLEEVKGYYTENLKFVLTYVEKVVKTYRRSSQIVITADHGECFGEHSLYEHPCDQTVPELTTVPWFIVT